MSKVTHTRIEKESLKLLKKVAESEERTMIVTLRKAIIEYAEKRGIEK